jgi:hypothetical protein
MISDCGMRIADLKKQHGAWGKKASSGQLAAGRKKKAKDRGQMISDCGMRIAYLGLMN